MSYKCGLLGGKLGHSFSPIIHEYIFRTNNIDASYELIECREDELKDKLDLIRSGEFFAYNVTIPHKQSVMKYLDEISIEAVKVGAVNTICMKDGKLIGFNTDYFGFKNEMSIYGVNPENRNCIILGCGGASKALASCLVDMNASVKLAIRKEDVEMASWFKDVILFDDLDKEDIDILVNATPVGMYPLVDNMPISCEIAKKANVIFDVIYNPLKTKLLSYAKEGYNGLYMLVLQAIKADEIFFNITVNNVTEIYDFVLKEVI